MVKIGIDVYSALHSPRGMGIYTINFLKYLSDIDDETQYILYGDIEDIENVLPKQENFKLKILKSRGLFDYEQFLLPRQCKKDGIDILHSPANTAPIFLDRKIKRILTLHDVIFLKKEVSFSKNKKQFFGRLYYIITSILNIKKVKKIFTVSNYSKDDISKTLHINKSKIIITYNGHEHFKIENSTDISELELKYKIPNKYFFHLGGEAPSKNTELLLKVFSQFPDKNLVVAGIKNLDNSILYNKYKQYTNIKFVPYISQKDLVGIYKNALSFIFPSIYEGFGIPLIEAMKCECPIISSNSSCLTEIAGDSAIYFNPQSTNELLEKIQELDLNINLRNELVHKGKERVTDFSWIKTAQIILNTYRELENA